MATVSRTRAWLVVVVATLTMTISYLDRQALSVLAPTVTEKFHISDENYGWLLAAFSVAYLAMAPFAGRWIDRFGARRGLPIAVVAWSIVAALHALLFGFWSLFFLRILLGAAEAPSFPGATQAVDRVLDPRDRARGVAVLFTGSSIGAMIVPSIAVAVNKAFGFRAAFVGIAIVGLAWLPLWSLVMRDAGVRAAMEARPTEADRVVSGPAASLTGVAVVRAVAAVLASAPTMAFMLLWGAKYLSRAHHISQDDLPKYLWLPPVAFDLGAVLFGDLAARRRHAGATSPPRALFAIGAALTSTVGLVSLVNSPWIATGLIAASVVGGGAMFALLAGDMMARVPADQVSAAAGITAAAQSIAYIVASPLIGRSVQATHSYSTALVGLAVVVIPGALVWLFAGPGPLRAEIANR